MLIKAELGCIKVYIAVILLLSGLFFPFQTYAELKEYIAIVKISLHQKTKDVFNEVAAYFEKKGDTELADIFKSFTEGGHGSGFVYLDGNGQNYIITNRHVVSQAEIVDVEFRKEDGTVTSFNNCPILYIDKSLDLAVLRFPDQEKVFSKGLTLDTSPLVEASDIYSAGYPGLFGRPGWQISKGIITNKSAEIPELVEGTLRRLIREIVAALYVYSWIPRRHSPNREKPQREPGLPGRSSLRGSLTGAARCPVSADKIHYEPLI